MRRGFVVCAPQSQTVPISVGTQEPHVAPCVRAAPLDTRGSGLANGLKKLISNPDEAALAEVAARTGDAEFLQKYREDREDQRQEQEATKFRQENPDTSNQ